jgi:hypothetical protein
MKSTIWWACFRNSSGSNGMNSRWGEEDSTELISRLPISVFDWGKKKFQNLRGVEENEEMVVMALKNGLVRGV